MGERQRDKETEAARLREGKGEAERNSVRKD